MFASLFSAFDEARCDSLEKLGSHSPSLFLCRFEQAFISRLLGEQIGKVTQYFWIGLQDVKDTGEYRWQGQNGSTETVAFTNWGWFEPGRSKLNGCCLAAKPTNFGFSVIAKSHFSVFRPPCVLQRGLEAVQSCPQQNPWASGR